MWWVWWCAHDTTTAELVREVLAEWVHERVDSTRKGRVDATLHTLDLLAKTLQLEFTGVNLRIKPAGNVAVGLVVPAHIVMQTEFSSSTPAFEQFGAGGGILNPPHSPCSDSHLLQ